MNQKHIIPLSGRLKKCKCGGDAELCCTHFSCPDGSGNFIFWVHCTRCRLITGNYDNRIAAINDWNHNRTLKLDWGMWDRESEHMERRYTIEVNERQLNFIREAAEEYMRIRMNQWVEFADSIAFAELDRSDYTGEEFDKMVAVRDELQEGMSKTLKAAYMELTGDSYGYEKTDEMLMAEDFYNVIMHERWKHGQQDKMDIHAFPPRQYSKEPLPLIKEIKE